MAALLNNYETIRENFGFGRKLCPVIKADAYGHGAIQVAKMLEQHGADFFAVSSLLEAEELRQSGITADILVLGYTPADCARRLSMGNISQCVFSSDYAEKLNAQAIADGVQVRVHLKLDTGMGRLGFDMRKCAENSLDQVEQVFTMYKLVVEGAFMHFAVADSVDAGDLDFTAQQKDFFFAAVKELEHRGHRIPIRHCCNSAATVTLGEQGDMARIGIILYGLMPSADIVLPKQIKPVMSLYSTVSMVKTLEKGQSVSYGRTYAADCVRTVATVSVGYADGVPRLLSNKGSVLIHGQRCPIIGRVCMDQLCVDVTEVPDVQQGDTVTIFGPGLPVEEVAELAQTINYEIVCGVTKRVRRVYI